MYNKNMREEVQRWLKQANHDLEMAQKNVIPMKNKIVQNFLDKYLETLKNRFHPQGMWLWGSYAYGKPNEFSDIDVLLVSKEFEKMRFIKRNSTITKELKTWADKEIPIIDFLCYTPEEFAKKQKEISLAQEIVQKGTKII